MLVVLAAEMNDGEVQRGEIARVRDIEVTKFAAVSVVAFVLVYVIH
jgi:hypothetical protein